MIIVLVIISIFTITGHSVHADGCGGFIEANNGALQLGPSSKMCFWVITLENTTGLRMELSPLMLTPILVTLQPNGSTQKLKPLRINGSKKSVYNFEGKSLTIMVPHRTEKFNLSWTGLDADTSGISFSTKFGNESNGTFLWKHDQDGRAEIFWAFHQKTNGKLDWNLDTLLPACDPVDPCQSISLAMFEIMADGNMSEIQRCCKIFKK